MRYTSTIFLLTLLACGNNQIMTERKFTELYISEMSKKYTEVKYKIISDLAVDADYKGKEFSHYLDNAYKDYKMQPVSLDQVIARYVSSAIELYKGPEPINVDDIVPIIKPTDHLEGLKQLSKEIGKEQEPWIVHEEYNSALIIVYAENTKKSIRYFTKEDFDKLKIPRDSLRALATRNLDRVLPEIQSKGENGTFMITAGGDFEASLVLLTSIWNNENFKVKGDFVIAIPNRDILMVTGSKDEQGIKTIKDITDESFETGNYQVSPYLFKWDGVKFEKWK